MNVDPRYEDMADEVLATVKTFHRAQDLGQATLRTWSTALQYASVQTTSDAVEAVLRHYTTPDNDPWITPAHVIAGVRAIRSSRLAGVDMVTPNVDPDNVAAYRAELAALRAAIADGTIDAATYTASGATLTGTPPAAITAPAPPPRDLRAALSAHWLSTVIRRPERPLPSDYGTAPVRYRPPAPDRRAEEEAFRAAQLAALAAHMTAGARADA